MNEEQHEQLEGLAGEIGMRRPFTSPELEAFLNIARTYAQLTANGTKMFKGLGLTGPQYNVLRILRGHGTPVSVYQIAQEMITPAPDMPRLVNRLVDREFVTKARCENDRRVVWVTITSQGKAILKKLDKPLDQLHRQQMAHMTAEELRQLSRLLYKVRNP